MTTTKVYEVARKWAVDSKDMVSILKDLGIEVKSHMSALSPEEVKKVTEFMAPTTKPQNATKPEKKKEPQSSKPAAPAARPTANNEKAAGRNERAVIWRERPASNAMPKVTIKQKPNTAAAPSEGMTAMTAERTSARGSDDKPKEKSEEKMARKSPNSEIQTENETAKNPVSQDEKLVTESTPKINAEIPQGDKSTQQAGEIPQGDRPAKPAGDRPQGDRPSRPAGDRPQGDRPPRPAGDRPQGDRPPRPAGDRPQGDRPSRPAGDRPQGDRPPRYAGDRPQGDRPPRYAGDRPQGDRPPRPAGDRPYGDRPPRPAGDRPYGDRPPRPAGDRPYGDRPPRPAGDRPYGDRPPRPAGDRPYGDRPPRPAGDRPYGDRPPRPAGDRPYGDRPPRPAGDRPYGDRPPRPAGDRPFGDRPPRPAGDRPFSGPKGAGDRGASTGERPPTKSIVKKYDDKKHKDEKDTKKDKLERLEKTGGYRDRNIRTGKTARKARAAREAKKLEVVEVLTPEQEEERAKSIMITVPITVKGFAEQIKRTSSDVIVKLMKLGVMANINQNIDEDMVLLLGDELGVKVMIEQVTEELEEVGIEDFEDKSEDLRERAPIVTVMGHVDHGKTSLLDAIRSTNIINTESGGITQHIGASAVRHNGKKIMFLDTPGHEAFTTMRARGAQVTDIAILVVAADDGVKPQTVEAISHAKAAGVPIIVAINKIDKPAADPSRAKQELTEHNILVEEWGGDVICVEVSAKAKIGIDNLLDMILLQADMLELKANPNRMAKGTVIEARLDNTKGSVMNVIIETGTLHVGDAIIAGNCYGKVRAMSNSKGVALKKAGPVTAVEVLGMSDVPEAGDMVYAVKDDKAARTIAENRQDKMREEVMKRTSHVTLDDLFNQIQKGNLKELNIIVKADVQGSAGALIQSLEKLSNDEVSIKIIHSSVGTFTESDVMLASTSNALLIGFNVRPSTNISIMAEREGVEIKTSRIIYEIINDIEAAMKGLLDPEYKEVVLGKIEIRNTFKVPNIGIIGGAYVLEGKAERNAQVRLLRDGIIVHEGKISSLKRFKDDAKEVAKGFECGIGIENYNDIKEGDIIEVFKMQEIERK